MEAVGLMKRIFYATDVHGSEKCFLKFLKAAEFYKADALVLGGDLTGKMVIPIIKQKDGTFLAEFLGYKRVIKSEKELKELETDIKNCGFYIYHTTPSEFEEIAADENRIKEIFERLMIETLEKWVNMAEDKLKGTNVKCYLTGGNDDPFVIDSMLRSLSTEHVRYVEGEVVEIGEYEMISSGYANMTPWNCPRDISDEELAKKIECMISKLKNPSMSIFNLHPPPYNTGLDTAYMVDKESKKQVSKSGQPILIPVGSVSVYKAIEKYQPLLGLHGHIHESRGVCKIGRTVCLNPGSEYGEGILRGVLVNLKGNKVESYLFTSG